MNNIYLFISLQPLDSQCSYLVQQRLSHAQETTVLYKFAAELGFEVSYAIRFVGFTSAHEVEEWYIIRFGIFDGCVGSHYGWIEVTVFLIQSAHVPLIDGFARQDGAHHAAYDFVIFLHQQVLTYPIAVELQEEVLAKERCAHFGAIELAKYLEPLMYFLLRLCLLHYSAILDGAFELALTALAEAMLRGAVDVDVVVFFVGESCGFEH